MYVIVFNFPGCVRYAGTVDGACGFATTLQEAHTFPTLEAAMRMLKNGYGEGSRSMAIPERREDIARRMQS